SPLTGAGVSVGVAVGATLPFALIAIGLMRLVARSRSWKPQTGVETWIGDVGRVTESIGHGAGGEAGRGLVFLRGELWRAESTHAIPEGARVRVVRVAGLTLHVEPLDS